MLEMPYSDSGDIAVSLTTGYSNAWMHFELTEEERLTSMRKSNLLSYFHGLLIVMAEEIIGLIGSHGLSAVHAQVKHCTINRRHPILSHGQNILQALCLPIRNQNNNYLTVGKFGISSFLSTNEFLCRGRLLCTSFNDPFSSYLRELK